MTFFFFKSKTKKKLLTSHLKVGKLIAKGGGITNKQTEDSGKEGVLTWVSADELWPGALLGGRGVGSANQFVLGHLGVGFGELQTQGLGNFWIKPDPLGSDGKTCKQEILSSRKILQ